MAELMLALMVFWFAGKWVLAEREARYYKKLIQRRIDEKSQERTTRNHNCT